MDIKKINRSSLVLFNSIILTLILVILSYMAFNGNGRYQIAGSGSPLLVDTRTGTVYRLTFNGDIYYLEDGRIKKKSFFSPQIGATPTTIKEETKKEAKTVADKYLEGINLGYLEEIEKEMEKAKEERKQYNKRREEWN